MFEGCCNVPAEYSMGGKGCVPCEEFVPFPGRTIDLLDKDLDFHLSLISKNYLDVTHTFVVKLKPKKGPLEVLTLAQKQNYVQQE